MPSISSCADSPLCVVIIAGAILAIIIITYAVLKATLYKRNCDSIDTMYNSIYGNNGMSKLKTLNFNNPDLSGNLRDYYIKTAYNCCSSGEFKNDWVGTCS